MGLFGFGKKKDPARSWKIEVDGESFINGPTLGDIEVQLTKLKNGNAEFFILSPSEPVKKCNFMQAASDADPELFHVEFSVLKDGGGYILYGKDALSFESSYDLFLDYMTHEQVPDADGWDIIMER